MSTRQCEGPQNCSSHFFFLFPHCATSFSLQFHLITVFNHSIPPIIPFLHTSSFLTIPLPLSLSPLSLSPPVSLSPVSLSPCLSLPCLSLPLSLSPLSSSPPCSPSPLLS